MALGGSRATETHRPDSDWDLGVYYRGAFASEGVHALAGGSGVVSEPGEWGPIMNGGAWLTLDGIAVDVLYRDLDTVERWTRDASHGRFEILTQNGYLAGAPTYLSAGELALCRVLSGELPRPAFTAELAASARPWEGKASVSLMFAGIHADAATRSPAPACSPTRRSARPTRGWPRARVGTQREAPRPPSRAGGRTGHTAFGRPRRGRGRGGGRPRHRAAGSALSGPTTPAPCARPRRTRRRSPRSGSR